jgi:polyribonucleotide nucleotidyltransferase
MENKTYQIDIGGKKLSIEISALAEQANAGVLVRYGDTVVLTTCVMSDSERLDIDFFPLMVDYEERFYAAGKILGARYIRRESRPTDEAILTARLIDRTIRPRFPKDLKREIQVVNTCLSWDGENDPDILCLLGASASLCLSDIPWQGPIAGVRVGKIDDKFILNPSYEQREKSELDLILCGTQEKNDILVNMIEAEAKEIQEKTILEAVAFAKPYFQEIFNFQKKIVQEIGKEKVKIELPEKEQELEDKIKNFLGDRLEKAVFQGDKTSRNDALKTLKQEMAAFVEQEYPEQGKAKYAKKFLDQEIKKIIFKRVAEKEERVDGRNLDEIREIKIDAGLLPRTHGSGLFSRGQTRALSILTLGAPGDQRLLEGMEIRGKKRFMHHYNFPPYSVGEVRPMRGPGRRDIGHGMLGEKALSPLIPEFDKFPYTIRIVSEILSSNGSSSMASVCAASLALMDAGVPIERPVAGIAMGLINGESENYKILTDIQGPEDNYGEMDFKVAGTSQGITAIQMDVKISGINEKIIKDTLEKAKESRQNILKEMEKVLPGARDKLSKWAPRIFILHIKPEKIRDVIGTGGKVINEIIEKCEVTIDIEDNGSIFITAEKEQAAEKAVEWINNITREVKPGEIFQGKVKRIMNFGAFVEILPGQEGLVHISKLSDKRVEKVEDVVSVGDIVPVKVISIDDQGRINLAMNGN